MAKIDEIWDLIESVSEGFPSYSSALRKKMATRAKNRKLGMTTALKPIDKFQNNFMEMFSHDPIPKLLKRFRSTE